jgi:hypothetical protein
MVSAKGMGMVKAHKETHARRSAILAVVFAAVAAYLVYSLRPGYVPTCNRQRMHRGDSCISFGAGGGGGNYDQLVHQHYRDYRIVFWIAVALTLLFIVLAIRDVIRARRGR